MQICIQQASVENGRYLVDPVAKQQASIENRNLRLCFGKEFSVQPAYRHGVLVAVKERAVDVAEVGKILSLASEVTT